MNSVAVAKRVSWRLGEWFPDLDHEKLSQMALLKEQILKYNEALILISPKTLPFMDALHFSDAIFASQLMVKDTRIKEVYDLGSGAGFPGLIFAIMNPNIKVHLVERDPAKADFLKKMVNMMRLNEVMVHQSLVENLKPLSVKSSFSRSMMTIPKLLLAMRKAVPKGGTLYVLKGEEWATELANIPSQLCSFWTPGLVGEYKLPIGNFKFAVVKFNKINE